MVVISDGVLQRFEDDNNGSFPTCEAETSVIDPKTIFADPDSPVRTFIERLANSVGRQKTSVAVVDPFQWTRKKI
jgi:hypothetical protein